VRHASGLENEISGPGDADLVTDLDAELALEHVGVLVLASVGVHRRGEDAWLDRMLDEREGSSALRSPDHEPHAEPAELHLLARCVGFPSWIASSRRSRLLGKVAANIMIAQRRVKLRAVRPCWPTFLPYSQVV
jgi:hypothetical protein